MTERKPWSEEEDRAIFELISKHGDKKWTVISESMEEEYQLTGRSGKQCRERWHNHLDPHISKIQWTLDEERILFEAHAELGNKWCEIARRIPGRTDNSTKNHFYSTLRRCLRRMNKYLGDKNSTEQVKDIKPGVLSKIFDMIDSQDQKLKSQENQINSYQLIQTEIQTENNEVQDQAEIHEILQISQYLKNTLLSFAHQAAPYQDSQSNIVIDNQNEHNKGRKQIRHKKQYINNIETINSTNSNIMANENESKQEMQNKFKHVLFQIAKFNRLYKRQKRAQFESDYRRQCVRRKRMLMLNDPKAFYSHFLHPQNYNHNIQQDQNVNNRIVQTANTANKRTDKERNFEEEFLFNNIHSVICKLQAKDKEIFEVYTFDRSTRNEGQNVTTKKQNKLTETQTEPMTVKLEPCTAQDINDIQTDCIVKEEEERLQQSNNDVDDDESLCLPSQCGQLSDTVSQNNDLYYKKALSEKSQTIGYNNRNEYLEIMQIPDMSLNPLASIYDNVPLLSNKGSQQRKPLISYCQENEFLLEQQIPQLLFFDASTNMIQYQSKFESNYANNSSFTNCFIDCRLDLEIV